MFSLLAPFDTKTIIFVSMLFTLLFIVVMLHMSFTRKVYEGFQYIILGHVFVLIGTVITLLLRDVISDFVSIFIGNLLLLMYPLCYYIGLMKFYKLPHTKTYLGILFIFIFVACFFIYLQEDINKRIAIHSTVGAFLFILASVKPILSETPKRYKIQKVMSISILPIGIFYIYRAYHAYYHTPYNNFQSLIETDNVLKVLFILSIFTAFMMFYCYLAITSDRLTIELKEARERELEAIKTHQQLFSVITHDLKTPITVINRAAQMIAHKLSRKDIEGAVQRLNTIKNNTLAMLALIDQWQDNAVLMTKGIKMNLSEINIVNLLSDTINNYRLMTDRKITLIINKNIPTYIGDVKLLQIVFNNLIDNAIKYSPSDTEIEVSITYEDKAIVIKVMDKGIGIPQSDIKNITSRFYRASNVQKYKGSGMGLHTSALIVAMHKGSIAIDSQINKGTTVKIILPYEMS